MNIASVLRTLWRHRKVVIPVFALSLLACIGAFYAAGPTYRASAAVVLLNPPALPEVTPENPEIPPEFQNPYARFGDLSVIVDILVRVIDSEPVKDSLAAKGLDGTYEIAANRDFYRGPIVDVSAEADTEAQALLNANLLIDEMQRELLDLQVQQGTAESYYIKSEIVVAPDKATRVLSKTLRLLILVAGLGMVVTVASGLIADARQRRRERYYAAYLEDLA